MGAVEIVERVLGEGLEVLEGMSVDRDDRLRGFLPCRDLDTTSHAKTSELANPLASDDEPAGQRALTLLAFVSPDEEKLRGQIVWRHPEAIVKELDRCILVEYVGQGDADLFGVGVIRVGDELGEALG